MVFFHEYSDTMMEYLSAGGAVMVPLAALSLVMWLLIINRSLYFRRLNAGRLTPAGALEHIARQSRPDTQRYQGAIALLVREFLERSTGRRNLDRYILDETVVVLTRSLDRHLAIIGVLAAIAPLLGLLGTVLGMITTFDVIAIYGTGNTKAMAGGISAALITTQTGLLVAIPGMYMKNFLVRRAEKLKRRIAAVAMFVRTRM
jgi:biopolymer transport protein ExbB